MQRCGICDGSADARKEEPQSAGRHQRPAAAMCDTTVRMPIIVKVGRKRNLAVPLGVLEYFTICVDAAFVFECVEWRKACQHLIEEDSKSPPVNLERVPALGSRRGEVR